MATMGWDDQQSVYNTVIMLKMKIFLFSCVKILEITLFPQVKGQPFKTNIAYIVTYFDKTSHPELQFSIEQFK